MRKTNGLLQVFIANIKGARASRGLTQQAVAERMGVAHSFYCNIENGNSNPRLDTIEKIAVALETPAHELIAGQEAAKEKKKRPRRTLALAKP